MDPIPENERKKSFSAEVDRKLKEEWPEIKQKMNTRYEKVLQACFKDDPEIFFNDAMLAAYQEAREIRYEESSKIYAEVYSTYYDK
jgi:hypothetical protein